MTSFFQIPNYQFNIIIQSLIFSSSYHHLLKMKQNFQKIFGSELRYNISVKEKSQDITVGKVNCSLPEHPNQLSTVTDKLQELGSLEKKTTNP